MDQHVARLGVGEPSRAQVEDRLVVELSDRRAVRALHVVGENLELRLRVDARTVGQEQGAVGLLGVGLLGVLPDDDLPVEHRARGAAEDSLVDLVAAVVRLGMVDRRVVVDEPIAVGEVQAVQRAVPAFAVEQRVGVVPDELAAQRERMRREARAARRVHVQAADVEGVERVLLDLVVVDAGVLAHEHFRHAVGQVGLPRAADVALDDPRLRARARNHEGPRMRHRLRDVRARHEHDVDRLLEHDPFGNVDERAVLHERRVQRREAAGREIRELAEVALDDVGVLLEGPGQRARVDARRQALGPRQRRVEAPVDDHQPQRGIGVGEAVQALGGAGHRFGRREVDRAQGGRVREAPLLVAHRGNAERGELRGAAGAEVFEPAGPALRPALQRAHERIDLFSNLSHRSPSSPSRKPKT